MTNTSESANKEELRIVSNKKLAEEVNAACAYGALLILSLLGFFIFLHLELVLFGVSFACLAALAMAGMVGAVLRYIRYLLQPYSSK